MKKLKNTGDGSCLLTVRQDGQSIPVRLTNAELYYLAGMLQARADVLYELHTRAPETDDELEERREAELYAAADGTGPLP